MERAAAAMATCNEQEARRTGAHGLAAGGLWRRRGGQRAMACWRWEHGEGEAREREGGLGVGSNGWWALHGSQRLKGRMLSSSGRWIEIANTKVGVNFHFPVN